MYELIKDTYQSLGTFTTVEEALQWPTLPGDYLIVNPNLVVLYDFTITRKQYFGNDFQ